MLLPLVTESIECVTALQQQERAGEVVEMDRLGVIFKGKRKLHAVWDTVNTLGLLAKYSCLESLDCSDKVLVNRLCRMAAVAGEVKATVETELLDYYTLTTNKNALWTVFQILVRQAVARLFRSQDQTGDNRLVIRVSLQESKDSGVEHLIFWFEDNGERMSSEEMEHAFALPDEMSVGRTELQERLELRLCWQIMRMMGGGIRIDPGYGQGRRVIVRVKNVEGVDAADGGGEGTEGTVPFVPSAGQQAGTVPSVPSEEKQVIYEI